MGRAQWATSRPRDGCAHIVETEHSPRRAGGGWHYPHGIHATLAAAPRDAGLQARTATLAEPERGLTAQALEATDVLLWWGARGGGRRGGGAGPEARARRHGSRRPALRAPVQAVPAADGHALHAELARRGRGRDGLDGPPGHPIAGGVPAAFEIPRQEMYGEFFDVPPPDELVFISSFAGGEVFRSGCCWTRGRGRVFYFSPGHETYPVYHQPEVRRVIVNGARWASRSRPAAPAGARTPR